MADADLIARSGATAPKQRLAAMPKQNPTAGTPPDAEAIEQAMTERCHPRSFIAAPMGTGMAAYAGAGGMIVSF